MKKSNPKAKKPLQKLIPVTRPTMERLSAYTPLFKQSIESGKLTMGPHIQEFEKKAAQYLGVKHCVALSSCTAGLMLVLKSLDLKGEVIVPSFTFGATALPLLWNNLTPVYADIDPKTYTIDPASVEKLITKKTSAIIATHVFGVLCDVKKLEALAKKHNLKLIFDAAHAFGTTAGNRHAGSFGDAEVFSMSPIKLLTAAEGGVVATNDDAIADFVRKARNYGDDGTNNFVVQGLSARLSEFHAAIALRSLAKLPKNLAQRNKKAAYLTAQLKKIEPRLQFQVVPVGTTATNYIFSIYINPEVLGYTRDQLFDFLAFCQIASRKYFHPTLHKQTLFKRFASKQATLPVTEDVSARVLSLPLYSHMPKSDIDRVLKAFALFTSEHTK